MQALFDLLQSLISTPSFSRQEAETADILASFFTRNHIPIHRQGHNIWAWASPPKATLPTILLNSHHDTVKPVSAWQRDPFQAGIEGDRLYGLGSNDAGGPLVSLIGTFLHFFGQSDLPFNLVMAATAEEEVSGKNGIASILSELGNIELGIIGEPTQMHLAIAEKGLMVLDCTAHGQAGHAAREEGINAIYQAMADIDWFRSYQFPDSSPMLGPVKMSVTQIEAGTQHNVVPDACTFVVDVRTNEFYSNHAAFDIIDAHTSCEVKARSFRLNSSRLPVEHAIVQRGLAMGRETFGSPTLSDQALIPYPTLKIGPGDSARSHTADEYICLSEIEEGVEIYIALLTGLILPKNTKTE
ncbi:MAG: M20 family metallo-hydrolase [Bacteroidota bacterium]